MKTHLLVCFSILVCATDDRDAARTYDVEAFIECIDEDTPSESNPEPTRDILESWSLGPWIAERGGS